MADSRLRPQLELKLNTLECPFNWVKEFASLHQENFKVETIEKKFKTSTEQDFLHFGFPINICLIYEYCTKKYATDVIQEMIDTSEKLLNHVIEDGSKNENKSNELIKKAKQSYKHVLQSCKTFFLFYCSEMKALQDVLEDMPKYETFNNEEQACVYGIKAAFLMIYGPYENTLVSIDCAKRAVQLDTTVGWYYFLAGKALYRHRTHYKMGNGPGREEVYFMNQARKIGFRNEEAGMFLIEMYSEIVFFKHDSHHKDYYKKTEGLCRNICDTSTDWYCLWRCCRSLLRFSKKYVDFDLVHQRLEKACRLSPKNPHILTTVSKAYELQNNLIEALTYAKMAAKENGAFGFVINVIRLQYRINYLSGVDMLPFFNEVIEITEDNTAKHLLMSYKARYLLLQKFDVKSSLELYMQVTQHNPNCLQEQKTACIQELHFLLLKLFSEIQTVVARNQLNSYQTKLDELKHLFPVLRDVEPIDVASFESYNKNGFVRWYHLDNMYQRPMLMHTTTKYDC